MVIINLPGQAKICILTTVVFVFAHPPLHAQPVRNSEAVVVAQGHQVSCVAFSPDSRLIACGGTNGVIKVWRVSDRIEQFVLRGHLQAILSLTFSSDGKTLVSSGFDFSIRVWDLKSGEEKHRLSGDTFHPAFSLSPTGRFLAYGTKNNTVVLWDFQTGKQSATLHGFESNVNSLNFSPDGRWLAAGSSDETVKLWKLSEMLDR